MFEYRKLLHYDSLKTFHVCLFFNKRYERQNKESGIQVVPLPCENNDRYIKELYN